MPRSLYGIDSESLASLNGRAHPGGGTATVEVPSGEGLIEDGFEAQLRNLQVAFRQPVARSLANLANRLEDRGFAQVAAEVDGVLEKWAGGEVAPGFMDDTDPDHPQMNEAQTTAEKNLAANLETLNQLVAANFDIQVLQSAMEEAAVVFGTPIGPMLFPAALMGKLPVPSYFVRQDQGKISQSLVKLNSLIQSKEYSVAWAVSKTLDSQVSAAARSHTYDLDDIFPVPGDAERFSAAKQELNTALSAALKDTQVQERHREESGARGTPQEQQLYQVLASKYAQAKDKGDQMDTDIRMYQSTLSDRSKLVYLNQIITSNIKSFAAVYNQWSHIEEIMKGLEVRQAVDSDQYQRLDDYFKHLDAATDTVLGAIKAQVSRLETGAI